MKTQRLAFLSKMPLWSWVIVALIGLWLFLVGFRTPFAAKVDYSTQIKPILNRRCIACHGGVKKNGDWSILFREEALGKTKSGKYAIVPGDASSSEMMRRIKSHDPEIRMPLDKEPLTESEIALLEQWIEEGAEWGEHWAYRPVQNVDVPKPSGLWQSLFPDPIFSTAKTDLDYFILDRLQKEHLSPAPKADPSTLLRRMSLDLTGLPPSTQLATQYFNAPKETRNEMLLDSLLRSKHFGEKWAALWLDLSRYADSKGYESDGGRNVWRYRDWLIRAFNADMPYDEFLTKQMAGDLLPNPTDNDYIATIFHRNSMSNDEGGADNEEFRIAAVMDRVSTTWEAISGTTFACIQCHSHPYDPFRHEEYYQYMAFFNNTRDNDSMQEYPLLRFFANQDDSLKALKVRNWVADQVSDDKAKAVYRFMRTWQPAVYGLSAIPLENAATVYTTHLGLRHQGSAVLKKAPIQGKSEMIVYFDAWQPNTKLTIRIGKPDGAILSQFIVPFNAQKRGWRIEKWQIPPQAEHQDLYFFAENAAFAQKPNETLLLIDWIAFNESFPGQGKTGYEEMQQAYWEVIQAPSQNVPIMYENPTSLTRSTHLFERGNWLTPGKKVTANVPHILNPFPKNAPLNRLGLAKWMTNTQNPLTARVLVNRLWEQLFGTGLVETVEDFGTQGSPPTHPELLDYLAYRFMNVHHWRIKPMLKEMMLSATYQQSSHVSADALNRDPYNKLWSHSSRIRLSAEQVRDQALQISGVFNPKMYGRSVMPYQPKGIWQAPWNGEQWVESKDGAQYRRALYTYWKRTSPYPSMLTFDGMSRNVCVSRRIRTNTPLQALVTLNDSVYVDLARHFTNRVLKETALSSSSDPSALIRKAYSLAVFRAISPQKERILKELYQKALRTYQTHPEQAVHLLADNTAKADPQKAAFVIVTNAIFNLDEVINRE